MEALWYALLARWQLPGAPAGEASADVARRAHVDVKNVIEVTVLDHRHACSHRVFADIDGRLDADLHSLDIGVLDGDVACQVIGAVVQLGPFGRDAVRRVRDRVGR